MKNKKYNLFIIIKMPETTDKNNIINPEIDLSKITKSICKKNHPNTKLFIEENPHLINNNFLSKNISDWSVDYLINILNTNNLDTMEKYFFSKNTNNKAVEYLIKNPDKINWYGFSENINEKAVEYLINNLDKIKWDATSNIKVDISLYFYIINV